MNPDWQSPCGRVQLYCGDCRDILPHLGKVDAVVTDPPYGIGESGKKHASRSKLAPAGKYQRGDWDNTTMQDEVEAALAVSRYAIVFGGNYYELPPSSCWLVWDKEITGDFADCELAWTNLRKAVRRIRYLWNGCMRNERHIPREHPTQKPLRVMEWCIEQLPGECNSILDPFMGSGTTGVAAVKARKSFIGIERERHYFEIAKRRIMDALGMETKGRDGLTQRRMFAPSEG